MLASNPSTPKLLGPAEKLDGSLETKIIEKTKCHFQTGCPGHLSFLHMLKMLWLDQGTLDI